MKYISLDTETTGLNPQTCHVIEIGAYVEDTDVLKPRNELPEFHLYIYRDVYIGEPYALAMNAHIFTKILELRKAGSPKVVGPHLVADIFSSWVYANFGDKRPTVAGKNAAGFDLPFLSQFIGWSRIKFHHRVIDPGMMYFDPHTDDVPPDLKLCKQRAKLSEVVSHEALDDAWDVIQLVREKYPLI